MSSPQRYMLVFLPSAARAVRGLPRDAQERVKIAAEKLRDEPRPHRCVKLAGPDNLWRVRTGQYRIIYTVDDGILVVTVVDAGHRREIYRQL